MHRAGTAASLDGSNSTKDKIGMVDYQDLSINFYLGKICLW